MNVPWSILALFSLQLQQTSITLTLFVECQQTIPPLGVERIQRVESTGLTPFGQHWQDILNVACLQKRFRRYSAADAPSSIMRQRNARRTLNKHTANSFGQEITLNESRARCSDGTHSNRIFWLTIWLNASTLYYNRIKPFEILQTVMRFPFKLVDGFILHIKGRAHFGFKIWATKSIDG